MTDPIDPTLGGLAPMDTPSDAPPRSLRARVDAARGGSADQNQQDLQPPTAGKPWTRREMRMTDPFNPGIVGAGDANPWYGKVGEPDDPWYMHEGHALANTPDLFMSPEELRRYYDPLNDTQLSDTGSPGHPDLKAEIAEQGIKYPVDLYTRGDLAKLEDGHHRLEIAEQLGLDKIPVRVTEEDWDRLVPPGSPQVTDGALKDWMDAKAAGTLPPRPSSEDIRLAYQRGNERNRITKLADSYEAGLDDSPEARAAHLARTDPESTWENGPDTARGPGAGAFDAGDVIPKEHAGSFDLGDVLGDFKEDAALGPAAAADLGPGGRDIMDQFVQDRVTGPAHLERIRSKDRRGFPLSDDEQMIFDHYGPGEPKPPPAKRLAKKAARPDSGSALGITGDPVLPVAGAGADDYMWPERESGKEEKALRRARTKLKNGAALTPDERDLLRADSETRDPWAPTKDNPTFAEVNNPNSMRYGALSPEDQAKVRAFVYGDVAPTPENVRDFKATMFGPDHPLGPGGSLPGEAGFFPPRPGPSTFDHLWSGAGSALDGLTAIGMVNQTQEAIQGAPRGARGPMTAGGIFAPAAGAMAGGSAATGIPLAGVGGLGMLGAAGFMGLSTATGAATGQEPSVDYTKPGGGPAPNFTATDANGNPTTDVAGNPFVPHADGRTPGVDYGPNGEVLAAGPRAPGAVDAAKPPSALQNMMQGRGQHPADYGPGPAGLPGAALPGASSENDPNGRNTPGIGTSHPSAFDPGRFPGRADNKAMPQPFAGPSPDNKLAPWDTPPDGAGGGIFPKGGKPQAHPSGYGTRWVPMIHHADGTTTELKLRKVSSNAAETHWEVENGPPLKPGDKAVTRHVQPPPAPKPAPAPRRK